MTGPTNEIGDIYANIRVTGNARTDEDVRRQFNKIGEEADRSGESAGRDYSHGFFRGMRNATEEDYREIHSLFTRLVQRMTDVFGGESGAAFASRFGETVRDHIRTHGGDIERDLVRETRRWGRRAGGAAGGGFIDAFSSFRNAFSGLSGPVAAFFNVSARSPAIALLIPVLGAIVALITAAVYWLQALVSLLYLIPSLLLAIGIQGTVLYLIFNNMAEAFQAVFGAKSQKDAEKAIKNIAGLNKEAGKFALSLYPFKAFVSGLQEVAQTNFFKQLNQEGQLNKILDNVKGPLTKVVGEVSTALGQSINDVLEAFTSPKFAKVLDTTGGSIVEWLTGGTNGVGVGQAIGVIVNGLNDLALALDPFLDWFGQGFNNTLVRIGNFFTNISKDPKFLQWVEDSKDIIKDGLPLIKELVNWIIVFIQQFIAADKYMKEKYGQGFLETLTVLIKTFIETVDSPTGKKALEGFITILDILTAAFLVLAGAITLGLAAFEIVFEVFYNIIKALYDSAQELGTAFGKIFKGDWLKPLIDGVGNIGNFFVNAKDKVVAGLNAVINELKNFTETAKNLLYNAGVDMIKRLADGIRSAFHFVSDAVKDGLSLISGHLPHSPAKTGPLSGKGDPLLAGQEFVNRLSAGIEMQGPKLASSVANTANTMMIGSGAIQINNYGPPPTAAQSQAMGAAVGRGLLGQFQATRLAARTL